MPPSWKEAWTWPHSVRQVGVAWRNARRGSGVTRRGGETWAYLSTITVRGRGYGSMPEMEEREACGSRQWLLAEAMGVIPSSKQTCAYWSGDMGLAVLPKR